MATFLEIREEVEDWVIDRPQRVQDALPRLVQRAHKRLQDRHNFVIMEAAASFVTVLATRSLGTLPPDYKAWRDEPYWRDNQGRAHQMAISPSREAVELEIDSAAEGPPLVILREEGYGDLDIYPLPDGNSLFGDGEYRVEVPYWKYLPELTANGDEDWFTQNAVQYLTHQTAAWAFFMDWDSEHGAEHSALAQQFFQEAITTDARVVATGFDTLVPHKGARRH